MSIPFVPVAPGLCNLAPTIGYAGALRFLFPDGTDLSGIDTVEAYDTSGDPEDLGTTTGSVTVDGTDYEHLTVSWTAEQSTGWADADELRWRASDAESVPWLAGRVYPTVEGDGGAGDGTTDTIVLPGETGTQTVYVQGVGPAGADGADGVDGEDGADGAPGDGSGDVTGPPGATAGNLPILDATGKILVDSGVSPAGLRPHFGSTPPEDTTTSWVKTDANLVAFMDFRQLENGLVPTETNGSGSGDPLTLSEGSTAAGVPPGVFAPAKVIGGRYRADESESLKLAALFTDMGAQPGSFRVTVGLGDWINREGNPDGTNSSNIVAANPLNGSGPIVHCYADYDGGLETHLEYGQDVLGVAELEGTAVIDRLLGSGDRYAIGYDGTDWHIYANGEQVATIATVDEDAADLSFLSMPISITGDVWGASMEWFAITSGDTDFDPAALTIHDYVGGEWVPRIAPANTSPREIDASQVTTGQFATARVASGTATEGHVPTVNSDGRLELAAPSGGSSGDTGTGGGLNNDGARLGAHEPILFPITGSGTNPAIPVGRQVYFRVDGMEPITCDEIGVNVVSSSLTAGQQIEVAVFDLAADGGPDSRLWVQTLTVGTSTGYISATGLSVSRPNAAWFSVLNPSGNAGAVTLTGVIPLRTSPLSTPSTAVRYMHYLESVASIPADMSASSINQQAASFDAPAIFGVKA